MNDGEIAFLPEPLFHFNYLFYAASVFWIFVTVVLWSLPGMLLRSGRDKAGLGAVCSLRLAGLCLFAAMLCGVVVLSIPIHFFHVLLIPLAIGGVVIFSLAAIWLDRVALPGALGKGKGWLRAAFLAQSASSGLAAWGGIFAVDCTPDLLGASGYEWLVVAGALAVAGAAGMVVTLLRWARNVFGYPELSRDLSICVAVLLLVLGLGWILCAVAGAQAREDIQERYLARGRIAALSLPLALVQEIMNPLSEDMQETHDSLVGRLQRILKADGEAEYAYLWTIHEGRIIFLADADRAGTEGETPPWFSYREAEQEDMEAFESDEPYFNEPFIDDWGVLVSANEPVWRNDDGGKLCWLGIDYPAQLWFSQVFHAMTMVFLGSGLAVLAVLFGLGLRLRGMRADILSIEADRAGAADRAKAEFIASLSHDLRTPLQAIAGCVDLLERSTLDKKTLMNSLKDNANTLLRFHEDILDFSALREEMLHIRSEPFDVASLCRSVALSARRQCQVKGLFFQWSLSRDFPSTAVGDPVRLRQILTNIIDNAVKFTAQGSVGLHCSLTGNGELRFVVEDTGPGISDEKKALIFEPFERAGAREPGTGLGLAIVKRLSVLLGGDVEWQRREGEGSRFVVTLPYHVADKETGMSSQQQKEVSTKVGEALIVEDHPEVLLVFEGYLQSLGWDTKGCDRVEKARAVMTWSQPQLLLVDITLPDGSVLDFIREVRRDKRDVRILCVSAATDNETISSALEAGADDFLHKPISFDAFAEALSAIFQDKRKPAALTELVEAGDVLAKQGDWKEVANVVHRMVNVTFALSVSGCAMDFGGLVRQCGVVERLARASDAIGAKEAWEDLVEIYAYLGRGPMER